MVLQYIVIIALLFHGMGHAMGLMPGWTKAQQALTGIPWAIPFDSSLAKLWGFVWLIAGILLIVGTLGILFKTSWWPQWLILGSLLSLLAIAPWFNTLPLLSRVGALGMDVLTIYLLIGPLRERVMQWFMKG